MSNQPTTIADIRHMFDIGNSIYYACVYPHFDWFEKVFSIQKIVSPSKVKITKQLLFSENIDNSDIVVLSKTNFSNVIRKYKLHVNLDNDQKFVATVYENSDKVVIVVYESHAIVSTHRGVVENDFYRLVIQTKSDLEFDETETTILKNDEYSTFKELYELASELYPEEVIKAYDKIKKNV